MEHAELLNEQDMATWTPVPENTVVGIVRYYYSEKDDEMYQMTFNLAKLPEGGLYEAFSIIDAKVKEKGLRQPTQEEINKFNKGIAGRMVAEFLNHLLEHQKERDAMQNLDQNTMMLAGHKGREGGDA